MDKTLKLSEWIIIFILCVSFSVLVSLMSLNASVQSSKHHPRVFVQIRPLMSRFSLCMKSILSLVIVNLSLIFYPWCSHTSLGFATWRTVMFSHVCLSESSATVWSVCSQTGFPLCVCALCHHGSLSDRLSPDNHLCYEERWVYRPACTWGTMNQHHFLLQRESKSQRSVRWCFYVLFGLFCFSCLCRRTERSKWTLKINPLWL